MVKDTQIRKDIAQAFVERAELLHMKKGVKRDQAALEFVVGAQAALTAAGVDISLDGMVYVTSIRGYETLARLAEEPA